MQRKLCHGSKRSLVKSGSLERRAAKWNMPRKPLTLLAHPPRLTDRGVGGAGPIKLLV